MVLGFVVVVVFVVVVAVVLFLFFGGVLMGGGEGWEFCSSRRSRDGIHEVYLKKVRPTKVPKKC